MNKVLIVGLSNQKGGIENFVLNYLKTQSSCEIHVDIVNAYGSIAFQEEFIKKDCRVYQTRKFLRNPIGYTIDLYKVIKLNQYNVIHYHMNSCVNLIPLILAKIVGCDLRIAHAHNSSSDKGFKKEIVHKINRPFVKLFANHYFTCSQKASKWFYEPYIEEKKIQFIPNAIEYDKFKFDENTRISYRKEFEVSDKFVIGHVGRFNKQKNHSYLIDIFEQVHKVEESAVLVLIGDGEDMENIKSIVRKKELDNDVIFLGSRDDVAQVYQMFDVFVLPSLYEGLPLVGVEAQVSGLPCIFSSVITDEVKLLDATTFIHLDDKRMWIDKILEFKNINRMVCRDQRFNLVNCAEWLQDLYRGKYENFN